HFTSIRRSLRVAVADRILVRSHARAVARPHITGGTACERVRPLRLAERRVRSLRDRQLSRRRWHETLPASRKHARHRRLARAERTLDRWEVVAGLTFSRSRRSPGWPHC